MNFIFLFLFRIIFYNIFKIEFYEAITIIYDNLKFIDKNLINMMIDEKDLDLKKYFNNNI